MGSELGCLGLYGLFVILTILIQAEAGRMQVGLPALLIPAALAPDSLGIPKAGDL